MENTNIDFDLIIRSSIVSNSDIILNTLFVDSNPVSIESVDVIKVDSKIKKVKTHKVYELDKRSVLDCSDINQQICDLLNSEFINKVKSINNNESIRYFNRGFLKNFTKKDPQIIINSINNCTWIITSDKICYELSKLDNYNLINRNISGVTKSGNINNINIYTSDKIDENDIFIGNSDSVDIIINKNIKSDGKLISIEFLFCANGIRKIRLE